jgi:hypothetical protein
VPFGLELRKLVGVMQESLETAKAREDEVPKKKPQ